MKILFVINSLIHGGAETQLIALSRALVARGHAVTVYTLQARNPRRAELESYGVTVVQDSKQRRFDVSLLRRLRSLIQELRPDIIQGFLLDGDLHARLAGFGLDIPVLNSERSSNYSVPLVHRVAMLFANRLVAGVVANSYSGAEFATRRFRLPESRVHVVWNGIDLDEVDRNVRDAQVNVKRHWFGRADVRVACLVGMIKPAKDYHLALDVADLLTRTSPEWRVLFIGDRLAHCDERYRASVDSRYRQLSLDGRATFAGLRDDVASVVSQCDVLFSTSSYEGFPNVVLEAMAAGTPAVSTEYSDIRRILPQSWQVTRTRSPQALVDAILRAAAERNELAAQQRSWILSHATLSTAAARLEAVYESYLSGIQKKVTGSDRAI
ncbi:MAG: glycosyltransferase [Deltaproteobacteria bacterium]|nr:glycosyltransferase [Deltaproteobacteria bacterium]